MSIIQPFFAQDTLSVDMVSAPWQKMDATTRDILIILGAVTLVTVLALIWAVVFRSRRRSHSRHHHHHHHHHHNHRHQDSSEEISTDTAVSEEEPAQSSSRRKGRRHRRREHRPRNPTLAETGGLPPLRSAPPPEP